MHTGKMVGTIRVDGGMVANDWLLQHLADVVVERPVVTETTALGAAYLAGLHDSPTTLPANWQLDRRVEPTMHAAQRERLLAGWDTAVRAVIDTTAAP